MTRHTRRKTMLPSCHFIDAWYGRLNQKINVTAMLNSATIGQFDSMNLIFNHDPCYGKIKYLFVKIESDDHYFYGLFNEYAQKPILPEKIITRRQYIKFYNAFPALLVYPLYLFFVETLTTTYNFDVSVVTELNPDDDSLYFITFAHNIQIEKLPINFIMYNFEYGGNYFNNHHFIDVLDRAWEIWDYSSINLSKTKRPNHIFIPYLPTKSATIVEKMKLFCTKERSIKYLFYGSLNEKRQSVLSQIKPTVKMLGASGTFLIGEKLYSQLANVETVINIHYYDDNVMEIYRFFECLLLGVKVISTEGYMDPVYKENLPNLTIVPNIVSFVNSIKV